MKEKLIIGLMIAATTTSLFAASGGKIDAPKHRLAPDVEARLAQREQRLLTKIQAMIKADTGYVTRILEEDRLVSERRETLKKVALKKQIKEALEKVDATIEEKDAALKAANTTLASTNKKHKIRLSNLEEKMMKAERKSLLEVAEARDEGNAYGKLIAGKEYQVELNTVRDEMNEEKDKNVFLSVQAALSKAIPKVRKEEQVRLIKAVKQAIVESKGRVDTANGRSDSGEVCQVNRKENFKGAFFEIIRVGKSTQYVFIDEDQKYDRLPSMIKNISSSGSVERLAVSYKNYNGYKGISEVYYSNIYGVGGADQFRCKMTWGSVHFNK